MLIEKILYNMELLDLNCEHMSNNVFEIKKLEGAVVPFKILIGIRNTIKFKKEFRTYFLT